MISYLVNDSATAIYSIAHSVAAVITILWSAINSSLIPYTYEKCKERDYASIDRITLPLIGLFAIGCTGVVLIAPEVVKLMATSEYSDAIYVIPPIVGGVFFQIQYFIYANVVYYHKKPVYIMVGSITAVIINLILNYFCIKRWGYIAAGYTTIVCYGIQAIIDFFAMRHITKVNVYNMKKIVFLSILILAVALFSNLVYNFPRARYSFLFFIFVFALLYRKRVFSFFLIRKENQKSEAESKITLEDSESVKGV